MNRPDMRRPLGWPLGRSHFGRPAAWRQCSSVGCQEILGHPLAVADLAAHRIDRMARQLGLDAPKPGQVVRGDGAFDTNAPVVASLR